APSQLSAIMQLPRRNDGAESRAVRAGDVTSRHRGCPQIHQSKSRAMNPAPRLRSATAFHPSGSAPIEASARHYFDSQQEEEGQVTDEPDKAWKPKTKRG